MTMAGATTRGGWGWLHQQQRRRWQRVLDSGELVPCANPDCLYPGLPVNPGYWHLGHNDQRSGWRGPEHPKCNVTEGARRAAAKTNRGRRLRQVAYRERW